MLQAPNDKQLEAIARLMVTEDFLEVLNFIEQNQDALAQRSLQLNGPECNRVQGAALITQELLLMLTTSRQTLVDKQERLRMPKKKNPFG
jgi:hypothetical protein